MNHELVQALKANMGKPVTPSMAADLLMAADGAATLVPSKTIASIEPGKHGEFVFTVERMADVAAEIRPLHRAHWDETEAHRHGLAFNPDYVTFIYYEKQGRYVLFTLRRDGVLLGNCAMYLSNSAHTQTLVATEDTLYLLPEARVGRTAMHFVGYVERALQSLGAREIDITVKTVNKAERFFRLLGYRHVENGLTKILEADHVQ